MSSANHRTLSCPNGAWTCAWTRAATRAATPVRAATGTRPRVANRLHAEPSFDARLVTCLRDPAVVELRAGGGGLDWRRLSAGRDDVDPLPDVIVGRGTFATVVASRTPGRCIKIERVIDSDPRGTLSNSLAISERMGDLGIGPRVHAWRVVGSASAGLFLITEMDRVEGWTLHALRGAHWTGGAARRTRDGNFDALEKVLVEKVRRMNAIGVRHNDLNPRNVMVDVAHMPWLIDFTFATQHRLGDAGDETATVFANLTGGQSRRDTGTNRAL